jgi:hypothetical protein
LSKTLHTLLRALIKLLFHTYGKGLYVSFLNMSTENRIKWCVVSFGRVLGASLPYRQLHYKRAALPWLRLERDASIVPLDNIFRYGEAEAQATFGG